MLWPSFLLPPCVFGALWIFVRFHPSRSSPPYVKFYFDYICSLSGFFLSLAVPCRLYIPACLFQMAPQLWFRIILFFPMDICDVVSYLVGSSLTFGSAFSIFCLSRTCWLCLRPVNPSCSFSNAIKSGCLISLNYLNLSF